MFVLFTFSGSVFGVLPRVKEAIFDDEDRLKEFLQLSEEKKLECDWSYGPNKNDYFNSLVNCWQIEENFKGSYAADYKVISNAQRDKYGTRIWNPGMEEGTLSLQPIPDYIRWVNENGELHYPSFEKTQHVTREDSKIATSSDLFLPGRILDTFFNIEPDSPDDILEQIAIFRGYQWKTSGSTLLHADANLTSHSARIWKKKRGVNITYIN